MKYIETTNIQLIADSCCDTTPAMRAAMGLCVVPLTITVDGDKEYRDDGNIPIKKLLADMKASKNPITTAAPAPGEYAELMRNADACVVVTLSSKLSGSFNSAMAARDLVLEEFPDKRIFVIDSKSAAAGQLRIVLQLESMLLRGATMDEIEEEMPAFVDNMRTLFVLEDLGNLIKNGRIPKLAGMIGTMLMLRPIMGENGNGEIVALEKVRGTIKALGRLVEILNEKTQKAKDIILTLSYCNCPERAADLKKMILDACAAIKEVVLVPTGGISTVYANQGGVIVAFA